MSLLDDAQASQLVTGGLGGLGLVTAAGLCDLGARSVILCSRRGRVAEGDEAVAVHLGPWEPGRWRRRSWRSCRRGLA